MQIFQKTKGFCNKRGLFRKKTHSFQSKPHLHSFRLGYRNNSIFEKKNRDPLRGRVSHLGLILLLIVFLGLCTIQGVAVSIRVRVGAFNASWHDASDLSERVGMLTELSCLTLGAVWTSDSEWAGPRCRPCTVMLDNDSQFCSQQKGTRQIQTIILRSG